MEISDVLMKRWIKTAPEELAFEMASAWSDARLGKREKIKHKILNKPFLVDLKEICEHLPSFIMNNKSLSYHDALEEISKFCGIQPEYCDMSDEEIEKIRSAREKMMDGINVKNPKLQSLMDHIKELERRIEKDEDTSPDALKIKY
jgi:hypothetical protein